MEVYVKKHNLLLIFVILFCHCLSHRNDIHIIFMVSILSEDMAFITLAAL